MPHVTTRRRLPLSPQQRLVIALAREIAPRPLRTTLLMQRFGWSRNRAYKVLRRLRDRGILRSQLMWPVMPRGGQHSPLIDPVTGERRHMSWLVCWLAPESEWDRSRDEVQFMFQPKAKRAA